MVLTLPHGELTYGWKTPRELRLEEDDENYLPPGIEKILELDELLVDDAFRNKGIGGLLVKWFFATPEAEEADAFFLDVSPSYLEDEGLTEAEAELYLRHFYSKFGFKSKTPHSRMWVFKKPLPIEDYPL